MPSPVGHFLGGIAGGLAVAGCRPSTGQGRATTGGMPAWSLGRLVVVFGLLGMAPDIDFLFGTHSTYTHSLGAAVIVGAAALALLEGRPVWLAVACAVACGSHVLLDWLATDTVPPIGVMALWPFSTRHFLSPLHWFLAIRREAWAAGTWTHNVWALGREVLLLGPVALLALRAARRRRG